MREKRGHVEERQLHLARDHRRDRLSGAALVGHVRELYARGFHQPLHVEVRIASQADRGEVDLAGLLLRRGDQLGDGVGRKARAGDDDVRDLDEFGDADEIARGLDLQLVGEDVLVDGVGRHVAHEQRVAVGRRLGGGFEREVAVGARAIFHQECLAHRLGQPLRDDARDDVGRASGAVGHEDLHRPGGIRFLRGRGRGTQDVKRHAKQQCA